VNLQGDAPLTRPEMLSQLIQAMEQDPQIKLASLAMPYALEQPTPAGTWVVMDLFQRALYFSKSPIPHLRQKTTRFRHIGVYAYTWDGLQEYCNLSPTPLEQAEQLEQLRALEHGIPIHMVLTEPSPQWSVDTPEDILIVEQLLKNKALAK
jgi:3-deoxy-manno-octulosonate cytidylyltransferase (CMP-KDO synthetase)